MSRLEISSLLIKKNNGTYTASAQTVGASDKFSLQFSLKNTGSYGMRYWSVLVEFISSDNVVGSTWVYGTSTSKTGMVARDVLAAGKSVTVTLSDITTASMGMNTLKNADSIAISVYGRVSGDSDSVYFSVREASTALAYVGERHQPTITEFSVTRNGNETSQLKLIARGTYGTQPPASASFGEAVKFEVSLNGGNFTAMTSDTITVSALLLGVEKLMTYTVGTSDKAVFRLTFYNAYETASVAQATVLPAFANMHLAGYSTGGVSFGGFSKSTQDNPKFECYYPATFYAGITGLGPNYGDIVAEETEIGTFLGQKLYRRVLDISVVHMSTTAATTTLPDDLVIGTLVQMYGAYSNGTVFMPLNSYYSSSYYAHARLATSTSVYTRSSEAMTSGYMIIEYTKG